MSLHALSDDTCRVDYEKLAPGEVAALRVLRDKASKKGWAKADDFAEIPTDDAPYRGSGQLVSVPLKVSIDDARKVLVRAMKPGRAMLSVVRFAGGAIEEVVDAKKAVDKSKKKPAKAADVPAPTRGCPAPDFERAEVRARDALLAFLTPEQTEDFARTQSFVARGVDTGHAYMLTSRHAKDRLSRYVRSLYDLDQRLPICTHDWSIPADEELLSLLAFLSVPNGEKFLRSATEDVFAPRAQLVTEAREIVLPEASTYIRACRIPEDVA